MANELNKIVADLNFNLVTDKDIKDQVERIYNLGYNAGKTDQKKITQRIKFRYNVLLDWYDNQLSQFSLFTKRFEYKNILDGISDQAEQFQFENKLTSSYKPRKIVHSITEKDSIDSNLVWIDGKNLVGITEDGLTVEIDVENDVSYILSDVVGDFIKEEDLKQQRELERKLNKQANNE